MLSQIIHEYDVDGDGGLDGLAAIVYLQSEYFIPTLDLLKFLVPEPNFGVPYISLTLFGANTRGVYVRITVMDGVSSRVHLERYLQVLSVLTRGADFESVLGEKARWEHELQHFPA